MITHYKPSQEYFFEEGIFINELSNHDADAALSIAQARLSSGKKTRWHLLTNTMERYVIQQGEGWVEVGEKPPTLVSVGDVVTIKAGIRQRIENRGSADLVFLALCTPRFDPIAYIDLEDTYA